MVCSDISSHWSRYMRWWIVICEAVAFKLVLWVLPIRRLRCLACEGFDIFVVLIACRIYGGIHFRKSIEDGLLVGEDVSIIHSLSHNWHFVLISTCGQCKFWKHRELCDSELISSCSFSLTYMRCLSVQVGDYVWEHFEEQFGDLWSVCKTFHLIWQQIL